MAQVVPAILSDNLSDFHQRLKAAVKFAPRIQIDIVDNKFAPYSSILCPKCVKQFSKTCFLEAHIMIEKPEKQIKKYQALGFKKVIPHFSALQDAQKYLSVAGVSVALNPENSLDLIKPYLDKIKTVLIMGVVPGQMGQTFIPQTLDKIGQLRALSDKIEIEVDGGVNSSNINQIIQVGADVVCVGSAIFSQGKPRENYEKILDKIEASDIAKARRRENGPRD